MTSQQASDQDPQLARIAELEAEVARLKARAAGPDLQGVADALPVLISYVDREQRYRFNNKIYEDVFGFTVEQLRGKHVRDVIGADAFERLKPVVQRVFAGEHVSTELLLPLESGARHVAIDYVPDTRGGQVIGYFALAKDISERKEGEARLRESEARFRAMADSAPVPAWVTNDEGIEFVNRALAEFAGVTPEQMLGDAWTRLIHPDDLPEVQRIRTKAWKEGVPYSFEARFRRGDGEWRWLMVSSRPREDIVGERRGYVGMAVDLTDMRAATDALRESEERYRSLFSSIDAGFCIVEVEFGPSGEATDYRFIEVNPAFEQQTDLKDAAGKSMRELAPNHEQHWFDLYGEIARTGVPKRFEQEAAALGQRWYDVYAYRTGPADAHRVAILFNDVTARRRAEQALTELNQSLEERITAGIAERERIEEALRQSQKMEAVGQLTGGIAHDFNNLLTVITGNLELAQRQVRAMDNPRLDRILANALTGAERAAVLTQRLLAFSRRQPLAPKATEPNRLVTGMSELLHRSLGETIAVETVLTPGVWQIEIDPNQLENAILNLALNARDAMEGGGKLTIETANTDFDGDYVAANHDVSPGQYVEICVTDTGAGMTAETLARAYEPFFTTKEVGKGTGLGLSMVYGFVKQSGGHVKIYSEQGRGTTVKLYFPRLAADAPEQDDVKASAIPESSGKETILVCEDDQDVRAYTVEVLRELGYRVLEAADGPSALRILEGKDGEVDLLFTDVVLPSGMNGEEVAERARAILPKLKVLFTTGYARNAMVHQGRLDPGVQLITKPFAYAELAARVRDMLDERP